MTLHDDEKVSGERFNDEPWGIDDDFRNGRDRRPGRQPIVTESEPPAHVSVDVSARDVSDRRVPPPVISAQEATPARRARCGSLDNRPPGADSVVAPPAPGYPPT